MIAMVIAGTPLRGIEATAPKALKVKDYLVSAAPLRLLVTGSPAPSSPWSIFLAQSRRKAAEPYDARTRPSLKNTLALVVSISARTAANTDTVQAFQKAFTGRIQALAATHSLLLESSWSSLKLGEMSV